ncbi:isocitrate lyase/PEP mutase family protein [Dyella tabacisoli]|uniref:Isocitrate lyase/phosphoenolpyruvate mutase family protein n=1 Tax=Dyella tabacisoli TaxID=2282381 RepID=A0A369UTA7_9GAMM|nr:isocitrate lyase/phosphoenolpyruvate mutase family protein [Dyella tabacisoli]RDD81579.1 isocitrate lyase/phosphoenolpyruvate mutase family protein [Dyella tabacisoli]
MPTQAEKAHLFKTYHAQPGAFLIPNPWDAGSARLLALLGFKALATTSAGFAFSQGLPDYGIDRDALLKHLRELVAATDLPISADLENGFGDEPDTVADTIRRAAATGIVGGSIEDATQRADAPIYPLEFAAERVRAAAEAARALPFPFTLTARAENYLHGRLDLGDTIARLQAYQEAGADVLFAPGLKTKEDIATVVSSVDRPVNVVMGLVGVPLGLRDLADIGVKRVSVGGSLARAALGAFLRAAHELSERGTFDYASEAIGSAEINRLFQSVVAPKDDRKA